METATFKASIVNATTRMKLDKKRYFHAICKSNFYTTYLAFCYFPSVFCSHQKLALPLTDEALGMQDC
jgi:hypothetical protein